MSTEGLKGIDALRRALHQTADDVRTTAARTVREADEVDAEKRRIAEQAAADAEDAAIAARRLEQESLDAQSAQDEKLRDIDHRAGQQTYILTGERPDVPAAEAPEPPLLTHQEPPAEPPAAPVTPQPQPPAHPVRDWLNHRPWWWWLVAILAAALMLAVVYPYWPTWPARGITSASLRAVVVLVAVLWAVIHAAVGFTVGGLIAYRIEHRSRREH